VLFLTTRLAGGSWCVAAGHAARMVPTILGEFAAVLLECGVSGAAFGMQASSSNATFERGLRL
jgi:hypothetical protein